MNEPAAQPVLLLLLVLMIPLATTELGTDSWITSLMEVPVREMAFLLMSVAAG